MTCDEKAKARANRELRTRKEPKKKENGLSSDETSAKFDLCPKISSGNLSGPLVLIIRSINFMLL